MTERIEDRRGTLSRKQKIAGAGVAIAALLGATGVGALLGSRGNDGPNNVSGVHYMDMGETYKVGPKSVVSGDVLIDGERYFDDNSKTALVVVLYEKAMVTAPWGATVKEDIDLGLLDTVVAQTTERVREANPEITDVTIVRFPKSE